MFDSVMNGSIFKPVKAGNCRLTATGQIAVKTEHGYKSYDLKKNKLVNQSNFVFDIGDDFFYVVPTNKVKPGDIILVNGKPRCVVTATKDRIEVVNYENSTLETVLPERHVFMGNTYFYGKIVSLFGSNFGKGNNIAKTMLKMKMMESFMGNAASSAGMPNAFGGGGNDFMKSMLMLNMFGGGGSGLGDLFENMFDFDSDDEEDTNILSSLMGSDDKDEETEEDDKEEK